MSQSLAKNMIHLIYSTKNRAPFLTPEIRPEMNSYLAGILRPSTGVLTSARAF